MMISCQPDGRLPQPVRPWKSGRVHLPDGSNVVVLELPYSTEFGRGQPPVLNNFFSELQYSAAFGRESRKVAGGV